jgi:hypothetical protein
MHIPVSLLLGLVMSIPHSTQPSLTYPHDLIHQQILRQSMRNKQHSDLSLKLVNGGSKVEAEGQALQFTGFAILDLTG